MGDFATVADISAAVANTAHIGCQQALHKSTLTTAANLYYSGWLTGGYPAVGATPGAAATCTRATAGALAPNFRAAVTGGTLRLLEWSYQQTSTTISSSLFDRLAHMGGLSGIVVTPTAQTVNVNLVTPSADGRCSSTGLDVEWFLEWYTATGSTACNATVSYTNEAGTAGRTVVIALPGTVTASRLYPIFPASPDLGIKSVESVTLSASTLTAGSFGVTAAKRLAIIPSVAPKFDSRFGGSCFPGGNDPFTLFMPKVGNNSCLWECIVSGSTAFGARIGQIIIGGRP